jgi:hypothetical protein
MWWVWLTTYNETNGAPFPTWDDAERYAERLRRVFPFALVEVIPDTVH